MRIGMPEDHGLPNEILNSALLHRSDSNEITLTDVQHAALEAGVARGSNVLVLAPTSSGKTDVGLFGAGSWLIRAKKGQFGDRLWCSSLSRS